MSKRRKKIMNKTELISKVVEVLANNEVKVTKKDMTSYVDTMVDVIKDAIMDGEDVKISGLGAFTVVDKPERTCRNPQDGSVITVAAHRAPKFKFSSNVKNALKA